MKTLLIVLLFNFLALGVCFNKCSMAMNSYLANKDDSLLQINYFTNGMPNRAILQLDSLFKVEICWYINGMTMSKKYYYKNYADEFYFEEWYENGMKKCESFYELDDSLNHFLAYYPDTTIIFKEHVFSATKIDTINCPSGFTGKDTSISVLSSHLLPIRSWYPSGRIEQECMKKDNKGVLVRKYYKSGLIKSQGYYFEGKQNGIWKYYSENGSLDKEEYYVKGRLNFR